jgi:hypothetical protein
MPTFLSRELIEPKAENQEEYTHTEQGKQLIHVINIYRALYPTTMGYIWFSSPHAMNDSLKHIIVSTITNF